MKKLILIFLIIVCSCGIIYLGYLIFKSKNIQSVELVGQMQTLYIVGDEIDYEDAKLKVTYKNGNIKMLDLDSSNVDILYFSTSVETHGKINIVYKSETIAVDYNVIQKGAYYLKDYKSKTYNPQEGRPNNYELIEEQYDTSSTQEMIYLAGNGVCNYYNRDGSGPWYMTDGSYFVDYNYSIVGDCLTVNVGKDMQYNIKVEYLESGKMLLNSVKSTTVEGAPELIKQHEVKVFEHTEEMKTNQTIGSAVVDYSKLTSGNEYVSFLKGQTYEEASPNVFIKVIYRQYSNESPFRVVYIKIHQNMIIKNFDTSNYINSVTYATLSYGGLSDIALGYTVK